MSVEDCVKEFAKAPLSGQIEKRVDDTLDMLKHVLLEIYNDTTGLDNININFSSDTTEGSNFLISIKKSPKLRMGYSNGTLYKRQTLAKDIISPLSMNSIFKDVNTSRDKFEIRTPVKPFEDGRQSFPLEIPKSSIKGKNKKLAKSAPNAKKQKSKKNKLPQTTQLEFGDSSPKNKSPKLNEEGDV